MRVGYQVDAVRHRAGALYAEIMTPVPTKIKPAVQAGTTSAQTLEAGNLPMRLRVACVNPMNLAVDCVWTWRILASDMREVAWMLRDGWF